MTKAQRNAMVIIAIGCLAGIVFAFSLGRTSSENVVKLPPPFAQIFPPPGDLDLRQVQPSVVMQPGYTADLEIDGREVVEDDLQRIEALHRVTYIPSPDSHIGPLGPGRHCVTARARGISEHTHDGAQYRWCFTLH